MSLKFGFSMGVSFFSMPKLLLFSAFFKLGVCCSPEDVLFAHNWFASGIFIPLYSAYTLLMSLISPFVIHLFAQVSHFVLDLIRPY